LTNKLKEILSKIGVFFSTVWDNLIVEAFRRLVSAIRGMVMIDGDVYFTTKQKKDGSPRVFSLYFGLIGAIIIGIFFATLVFVAARAMTDYYINSVYLDDAHRVAREELLLEDLQSFIDERGITGEDAKEELQEWITDNRYVYLSVRLDEDLIFSSITDKPPVSEGEESEGGGVFSKPDANEILKIAESLDLKTISDADGESLHVQIYDYSEYFQRDILSVISFVISMIVLGAVVVEHFGRLIARINRLQYDVNEVSRGHLDHPIVATGFDELTKLSYDVENMRSAMLDNIEKEREALQMNTELITSMSHDIRTPLTVLMGYVDIMKSDLPPEEMREYVLASEKTVQRLKQLSDDMFKYFRAFGKGAEGITMEEYNASTLFEQLLTEHVFLLGESGYQVDYNIDELMDGKSIVKTDAPHMMRVMDNIFSNLYKYADIEKEVSVKGRREGDLAVFEFKNYVSENKGAESSKVGLKTCKRLASYIMNSFDWGEDEGVFTLTLSLKLYDEETKISESFYIR
jgi:signal transduction histidine kinase